MQEFQEQVLEPSPTTPSCMSQKQGHEQSQKHQTTKTKKPKQTNQHTKGKG